MLQTEEHQQDQPTGRHHVVFSDPSLIITLYILSSPASRRSRLRRRVTTDKHQTAGAQSATKKPSGDPEPSAQKTRVCFISAPPVQSLT